MRGTGMPWREARAVGDRGEELAVEHLREQGLEILDRNWRCPEGELDVVAVDGDGVVVFCEVKTRRSLRFGWPVEAVTPEKARRLRRLAWSWLRETGHRPAQFRIDVIGVHCPATGPVEVQHLRAVA